MFAIHIQWNQAMFGADSLQALFIDIIANIRKLNKNKNNEISSIKYPLD